MAGQYTIIITDKIHEKARKIRRNRDLQQVSKTYLITENNHRIHLKPPRGAALRGYQADVVINHTEHKNLTQIAAKPDGFQINVPDT